MRVHIQSSTATDALWGVVVVVVVLVVLACREVRT